MKRASASHHAGAGETLFESPAARLAFEARLREFARAVALRHKRGRVNRAGFEAALRGYYAAFTLFATSPVPALDDAAMAGALATYLAAVSGERALAA